MKKLLLSAVALAMLASCTNDEEGALRPKSDQIGFSGVFSNTLTRAANGFCNNNKPQTFGASMFYETVAGSGNFTKAAFKNETFTTEDFNLWTASTGVISWPNELPKNSENTFKIWAYTIPSYPFTASFTHAYPTEPAKEYYQVGYSVPTNVAEQEDLCVAAYVGKRGEMTTIPLNFKHILSQLDFAVKNGNGTTQVEVAALKVMNVKGKGASIKFPTSTTGVGTNNHSTGTSYGGFGGAAVWVKEATLDTYELTFDGMTQVTGNQTVALSATTAEDWAVNSMYLLPQTTLQSTDFTAVSTTAPAEGTPCIAVKLNIWNVCGSTLNKDTDVLLFGEKNVGTWVYIPFPNSTWAMGKRYHYTLVVTGATGGLNEIKLDCMVDDFYPNGETEIKTTL